MGNLMKVEFPGLLKETRANGKIRYRVRVKGNKAKRVTLHVTPDDPKFTEHYLAARSGVEIKVEKKETTEIYGTLAWLGDLYIAHLETEVENDLLSPKTLKKKQGHLKTLKGECGDFAVNIPQKEVVNIRNKMAKTPAAADSFVSFLKTMFAWAVEQSIVPVNPAVGVGKIDKGKGGATPWSVDDIEKFKETHKPGSEAHFCLTLLLFTGCRIGDAAILGKEHETTFAGHKCLKWQPGKRGSAQVTVPIMAPLQEAIDRTDRFRRTYLLTEYGRSFASGDSLSARFKKWCVQAGLPERSAHGVRKALGHLLAELGCTQHQIMAVLGHTQAQTSEIYTKDVERAKLAKDAMEALNGFKW